MILIITLFLYVIFLVFTNRFYKSEDYKGIDKIFMGGSLYISNKLSGMDIIKNYSKDFEKIGEKPELVIKKYSLIALKLIFIALIIMIIADFSSDDNFNGRYIARPEHFEYTQEKELNYKIGNKTGKIEVELERKHFTKKELLGKKDLIRKEIISNILGDNKSLDNVIYPLKLIDRLDKYDAQIYWDIDTKDIDEDGNLQINKGIKHTTLIANISFYDVEYTEKIEAYLKKMSFNEDDIKKNIKLEKSKILLPQKIGEDKLYWYENKDSSIGKVFIVALMAIVAIFYGIELCRKKVIKREEELKLEYSNVVNLIVLYMEAGLSLNKAWLEVVNFYENKDAYISKEMSKTKNDILQGKGMEEVFNNFSKSCSLKSYRKLSQIIIQNIRSGTSTILDILKKELIDARKDRVDIAKMLGKKAEVKLMLPMMLMLLVVFIILLAPSMLSIRL